MRDLTSILTVVSTCSATIIAIVGGFITSRLINIIDERKKIDNRIKQITDEVSLKNESIDTYEKKVVDSYAHEFLLNNIEELIDDKKLEDIFNIGDITIDDMYEHWKKGKAILQLINTYISQHPSSTDKSILDYLKLNNYCNKNDLEISKAIIEWIRYRERQQSSSGILLGMPPIRTIDIFGNKSRENNKVFMEQKKLEVSWLSIEKQNLINEKETLRDPVEEIKGLKVFIVLLSSILIPMLMLIHPYVKNYSIYLICCILNILLFCIGFGLIIKYLYDRLCDNDLK